MIYMKDLNLTELSCNSVKDLYLVANKYEFAEGVNLLREFISSQSNDALYYYELSRMCSDKVLEAGLLGYLKDIKEAISSVHFLHSTPETICTIYNNHMLSSDCMEELVNALDQYVEVNKPNDPQILIKVQDALKGIRFKKLPNKVILRTNLLSAKVKLCFYAVLNGLLNVTSVSSFEISNLSSKDKDFIKTGCLIIK